MATSNPASLDCGKLRQQILERLEGNPYYNDIDFYLESHFSWSEKQTRKGDIEEAERWLRWAHHNSNLKCVTASVPLGVLPCGLQGELIDVKVFVRRGPDDAVYDNNDKIRQKVARGNCFLRIQSGPEAGVYCVLQAMKKFTGGLGDDDDRETGDNFVWQKYFTKSLDDASVVIATRKANGEAAHLSCCMIDGEYVLCGGSKNVHMLFRKKDDIKKYGEPRFRIAREVCETVMDTIEAMKPDEKDRLLKFLALSRYTGVFEILSPDHQHVENLSYLRGPEMRFITWTRCDLEPSGNDVAAVPPHIGIEIARSLGLLTISYDKIPVKNLDSRMKQIRQGYQFEGEVLYFLDKDNTVMGLLKKKTVWYIMCRAIREKLRGACANNLKFRESFDIKKVLRKTEGRMKEIQKWLSLDDGIVDFWKNLGQKFLKWTLERFEGGSIQMEDVADKFPVVWESFLKDTKETDKYTAKRAEGTNTLDDSEAICGLRQHQKSPIESITTESHSHSSDNSENSTSDSSERTSSNSDERSLNRSMDVNETKEFPQKEETTCLDSAMAATNIKEGTAVSNECL